MQRDPGHELISLVLFVGVDERNLHFNPAAKEILVVQSDFRSEPGACSIAINTEADSGSLLVVGFLELQGGSRGRDVVQSI